MPCVGSQQAVSMVQHEAPNTGSSGVGNKQIPTVLWCAYEQLLSVAGWCAIVSCYIREVHPYLPVHK